MLFLILFERSSQAWVCAGICGETEPNNVKQPAENIDVSSPRALVAIYASLERSKLMRQLAICAQSAHGIKVYALSA